jgi:hypothetical protein
MRPFETIIRRGRGINFCKLSQCTSSTIIIIIIINYSLENLALHGQATPGRWYSKILTLESILYQRDRIKK